MKEIKFPLLTREDIELRIGQMSKDGTKASLLLYQDARCGMKYLDQVVGAGKWQKKYYEVRGLVICSLGIYDDDTQQWVWKDDTGTAGSIEEEKSIISDSFKRCCVCWGLARELYTSPTIWVKVESKYDKFYVKSISYNEQREIKSIEIVNEKHELVYSWGNGAKVSNNATTSQNKGISQDTTPLEQDIALIKDYFKGDETRLSNYLMRAYKVGDLEALTSEQAHHIAETIRKK